LNNPANESTAHIRVALVDCGGLLGDIVRRAVTAEPDLDVIADLELSSAVRVPVAIDADLVLWNNADDSRVEHWLSDRSMQRAPRVLATLGDGRDAALWELTPHKTRLGPLSPATLVDVIRQSLKSPDRGST
jgi:hypothetical protein